MSEIRVKENESLESALKRFKRSCQKDGVIAEVKKREHYVSPSLKRKQKSEAARKNKRRGYRSLRLIVAFTPPMRFFASAVFCVAFSLFLR